MTSLNAPLRIALGMAVLSVVACKSQSSSTTHSAGGAKASATVTSSAVGTSSDASQAYTERTKSNTTSPCETTETTEADAPKTYVNDVMQLQDGDTETSTSDSTSAQPCADSTTSTDTSTGATTGTTAAAETSTAASSTTIPAKIGDETTLSNTSPLNLLTQLNLERYTNSGYRTWASKARPGYVQGLKIYAKVYVNRTLATDLGATPPPASHTVGSISVMEAYGDANGTQFLGWYVLGKVNKDADGWFTYQMTGTPASVAGGQPSFPSAPQAYGLKVAACNSCHSSAAYPAYIIGP